METRWYARGRTVILIESPPVEYHLKGIVRRVFRLPKLIKAPLYKTLLGGIINRFLATLLLTVPVLMRI